MECHYYCQGHLLSFYEQLHIYTPTLVYIKFLGQTERQTLSKYIVIADLQTIFHT